MRKVLHRFALSSLSALLFLQVFAIGIVAGAPTPVLASQPIIISELQTEGLVDSVAAARSEFIELYNPNEAPVDMTDWQLHYLSARHTGQGAPTRVLATISGYILPKSYVLIASEGYSQTDVPLPTISVSGSLARSGGHLRLVSGQAAIIDALTWGSAAVLASEPKVPEIPAGMSVQRVLPSNPPLGDGIYTEASSTITPQGGGLKAWPDSELACKEMVFSEILANPEGADKGKEFVELYNPTKIALSLKGCSLRLGEAGTEYLLPDEQVEPHGYRAFFDAETDITLPNTTAQTLYLLAGHEKQSIQYPNDTNDNTAWAFISGLWQVTLLPSPGAPNVLSAPKTPELEPEPTVPVSCPAGKERNPATNRCRTTVIEAALQPCSLAKKGKNVILKPDGAEHWLRQPARVPYHATQGRSVTQLLTVAGQF